MCLIICFRAMTLWSEQADTVRAALQLYRAGKADFPDCLIAGFGPSRRMQPEPSHLTDCRPRCAMELLD